LATTCRNPNEGHLFKSNKKMKRNGNEKIWWIWQKKKQGTAPHISQGTVVKLWHLHWYIGSVHSTEVPCSNSVKFLGSVQCSNDVWSSQGLCSVAMMCEVPRVCAQYWGTV
jgi:hypothetical protein